MNIKRKITPGCAAMFLVSMLVYRVGLAASSGIEHAEKSGRTETAACDAALDRAEQAAKVNTITLYGDSGITKKECKCKEHAPKGSDNYTWSCIGMVQWEKRGK